MGTAEQTQVGCIRLNTLSVRSLESLLRSLRSGLGLQRAPEGSTLPSFVRGKGFLTQLPLLYMFVLQPSPELTGLWNHSVGCR